MIDLTDLVTMSQHAGRDRRLAQGGGGNASIKSWDGRRMWIKASGWRMEQVQPGAGYVETDVETLRALLAEAALARLPREQAHSRAVDRTQAAAVGAGNLRPSLETTFHAMLGRAVLHTHPVYVNAFTCMQGGAEALRDSRPDAGPWLAYATPGYALGRAVAAAVQVCQDASGRPPSELYLANHGFIAAADDAVEAIEITQEAVRAAERYFGPLPAEAGETAAPALALARWADGVAAELQRREAGVGVCVRPARQAALLAAAQEPEQWLLGGALVPDDVVYGGHRVWAAEPGQAPKDWLDSAPEAWAQTGRLILAVRGLGVILAGPSESFLEAMEENLWAHVLIRRLIARRGTPVPLPGPEVQYLLRMESEKYRQGVAAAAKQGD